VDQQYWQSMQCPLNPAYICPFNNPMRPFDFEETRQNPQDVNRIMALIDEEFENYYAELQRYGVPRFITRNIFRDIVTYVLANESKYSGSITQKTNQLFNAYRRDNPGAFVALLGFGVPAGLINQIFRDIIRFTLENIDTAPAPPVTGWSRWEDLGGILSSAPAVSSWSANRLDVFGRGQNNALWHKSIIPVSIPNLSISFLKGSKIISVS
jgi:hypothetical protein